MQYLAVDLVEGQKKLAFGSCQFAEGRSACKMEVRVAQRDQEDKGN